MELELEEKTNKKETKVIHYNKNYIEYVKRELENLRWEHSWMESYYKNDKFKGSGIYENDNYEGVARYCRCYLCRPILYEHLFDIKDKEIHQILLGLN